VHEGKEKFKNAVTSGGLTDNTWNTKKTKVVVGITRPGDYGAAKMSRTSAGMTKTPGENQALLAAGQGDPDPIGMLTFEATHLGPLRSLDRRANPEDKPDRRGAMGTRLADTNPMASGLQNNFRDQWMESRADGQNQRLSIMSSFTR
jgi:hypothetical protein